MGNMIWGIEITLIERKITSMGKRGKEEEG